MSDRLLSIYRLTTLVAALLVFAVAAVPAGASERVYNSVRHIVVKGSFDCYGDPEDVHVDRYVSGVKVSRDGRFRIPDADVSLRGRYVTRSKIQGTLVAKTLSCNSPQETFRAVHR